VTRGWLRRSGQAWKMTGLLIWNFTGLALLVMGATYRALSAPAIVIGLMFLVAYFCLPMLVRCRVCRVQTFTSANALQLGRGDRVAWMWSIEACPVCGDDGRATSESRARWIASGTVPEGAYWSSRRILMALLFTIALIGGGLAAAQCRIRALRQEWSREGVSQMEEDVRPSACDGASNGPTISAAALHAVRAGHSPAWHAPCRPCGTPRAGERGAGLWGVRRSGTDARPTAQRASLMGLLPLN
jgi:hypothetical protein